MVVKRVSIAIAGDRISNSRIRMLFSMKMWEIINWTQCVAHTNYNRSSSAIAIQSIVHQNRNILICIHTIFSIKTDKMYLVSCRNVESMEFITIRIVDCVFNQLVNDR